MESKKDTLSADMINEVRTICESPDYAENIIKNASMAAFGLSKWVKAICEYDKVARIVAPKKKKYAEASDEAKKATDKWQATLKILQDKEALIKKLQDDFKEANDKKDKLEKEANECRIKLNRATEIVELLKSENKRWVNSVENLNAGYTTLIGDILLSSGIIVYMGVFPNDYRESCLENWNELIDKCEIIKSPKFQFIKILGDPVKIR